MITENDIIEKLQSTAINKGVNLTYTHKLFFLKLLDYAKEHGESCPEGMQILVSVSNLSKKLSISPRMVTQSLQVFRECGIIQRRAGEKTFPRSISTTVLKKEFYDE